MTLFDPTSWAPPSTLYWASVPHEPGAARAAPGLPPPGSTLIVDTLPGMCILALEGQNRGDIDRGGGAVHDGELTIAGIRQL